MRIIKSGTEPNKLKQSGYKDDILKRTYLRFCFAKTLNHKLLIMNVVAYFRLWITFCKTRNALNISEMFKKFNCKIKYRKTCDWAILIGLTDRDKMFIGMSSARMRAACRWVKTVWVEPLTSDNLEGKF